MAITIQRPIVATTLLVLLAAVAGCSPQAPPTPARTTVVVVHNANEQAPALGDTLRARLAADATDPADDGAVAHVLAAGRPGVETVDLEPRRPNGAVERGPRVGMLVNERFGPDRRVATPTCCAPSTPPRGPATGQSSCCPRA
jgi:hypothetical protein